MNSVQQNYKEIEEKIRLWAENEDPVRALVVIGSQARADHLADAWSDLDLVLFVTDAGRYTRDGSWLEQIGDSWLKVLQVTGSGHPEWLVLFAGGYKVDFLFATIAPSLSETLNGPVFGDVCLQGVRILFDKEGGGAGVAPDPPAGRPKLDEADFEMAVQAFWIATYRAANMIRRGDLWRAREIMDADLRRQLRDMLAWHAQARRGSEKGAWHDGRFMEEWADSQVVAELPRLFAPLEAPATAQALRLLIRLYDRLAVETATLKQYPYPATSVDRVRDWIAAALNEIA